MRLTNKFDLIKSNSANNYVQDTMELGLPYVPLYLRPCSTLFVGSPLQGRIQAGPAGPFGPGLSLKRGPPFGVIYTTYFFVVTVNIFRKNFHETDFGYDISNTLNISSGIALE